MPRKHLTTTKYDPAKTPIDAYILAKSGLSDPKLALALGCHESVFKEWKKRYVPLQYALEQARGKDGSGETFSDYVYKRLTPELQRLWDEIEWWSENPSGFEAMEQALTKESVKVRQSLFMHAMVVCNFSASEACRKVGLSKSTVDFWLKEDPDFPRLIEEIQWHKKNFFEQGLVKLVNEGNPLAIIFANRTLNRDRGYSEKLLVEHSGTVTHLLIPLQRLNLPMEVLLQIEEAMAQLPEYQKTLPPGDNKEVINLPPEAEQESA